MPVLLQDLYVYVSPSTVPFHKPFLSDSLSFSPSLLLMYFWCTITLGIAWATPTELISSEPVKSLVQIHVAHIALTGLESWFGSGLSERSWHHLLPWAAHPWVQLPPTPTPFTLFPALPPTSMTLYVNLNRLVLSDARISKGRTVLVLVELCWLAYWHVRIAFKCAGIFNVLI